MTQRSFARWHFLGRHVLLSLLAAGGSLAALVACKPQNDGSSGSSFSRSTDGSASGSAGPAPGTFTSPYFDERAREELGAAGLSIDHFRQGQRLYELYCLNCHRPPDGEGPRGRLAPPGFAMALRYREHFGDTAERIQAIRDFTASPRKENALMPGAVEQFGLMSAMPLSETELKKVSTFLATAYFETPPGHRPGARGTGGGRDE